jgi:hypothetical protein
VGKKSLEYRGEKMRKISGEEENYFLKHAAWGIGVSGLHVIPCVN